MREPEIYLGTNAIAALFLDFDAHHSAIATVIDSAGSSLLISDFGILDFSSVLSRLIRTSLLQLDEARSIEARFASWVADNAETVNLEPSDVQRARNWINTFTTALRAPDALHLAIAARTGATVLTFDRQLAGCARTFGVTVAEAPGQ